MKKLHIKNGSGLLLRVNHLWNVVVQVLNYLINRHPDFFYVVFYFYFIVFLPYNLESVFLVIIIISHLKTDIRILLVIVTQQLEVTVQTIIRIWPWPLKGIPKINCRIAIWWIGIKKSHLVSLVWFVISSKSMAVDKP